MHPKWLHPDGAVYIIKLYRLPVSLLNMCLPLLAGVGASPRKDSKKGIEKD